MTAGHVFKNVKFISFNLFGLKNSLKSLALNMAVIVSFIQLKSSNTVEAASFSETTRKQDFTDSAGEASCKRMRQDSRLQSPEISSESESQVEQEDSQFSASREKKLDNLTR